MELMYTLPSLYFVDLEFLSIALIFGFGPRDCLNLFLRPVCTIIQTIHSGFVRQLTFYNQAHIDEGQRKNGFKAVKSGIHTNFVSHCIIEDFTIETTVD